MPPRRRARIAVAVIVGLVVFLLASLAHEVRAKDRQLDRLAAAQQTVVDKLADVFAHTLAAEKAALEAGQTPAVRLEDVLAQVRGVDQSVVTEALQKAYKAVSGPPGPAGPQGPPGPAAAATTTTTAATTTTSTTRPAPATTTTRPTPSSTTTTTGRRCTAYLAGVCLLEVP